MQRILLIENDAAVRDSIVRVIRAAGYEVQIAADEGEVVAALRSRSIELVLLDLDLPDCGGWDVLERCLTEAPSLPFILFTDYSDQCECGWLSGRGVLLEKPLSPPVLLAVLREMLEGSVLSEKTVSLHLKVQSKVIAENALGRPRETPVDIVANDNNA